MNYLVLWNLNIYFSLNNPGSRLKRSGRSRSLWKTRVYLCFYYVVYFHWLLCYGYLWIWPRMSI